MVPHAMHEVPPESITKVVSGIVTRYHGEKRHLMRMLQEIQAVYGYLPREALEELSRLTGIPLVDILTVATFYHQFKLERPGYYIILVCMGTACHLKGNLDNYEAMRSFLGLRKYEKTAKDGTVTIEKARCFGACSLAPVVMVVSRDGKERYLHGHVTLQEARRIVAKYRALALRKMREEK